MEWAPAAERPTAASFLNPLKPFSTICTFHSTFKYMKQRDTLSAGYTNFMTDNSRFSQKSISRSHILNFQGKSKTYQPSFQNSAWLIANISRPDFSQSLWIHKDFTSILSAEMGSITWSSLMTLFQSWATNNFQLGDSTLRNLGSWSLWKPGLRKNEVFKELLVPNLMNSLKLLGFLDTELFPSRNS